MRENKEKKKKEEMLHKTINKKRNRVTDTEETQVAARVQRDGEMMRDKKLVRG